MPQPVRDIVMHLELYSKVDAGDLRLENTACSGPWTRIPARCNRRKSRDGLCAPAMRGYLPNALLRNQAFVQSKHFLESVDTPALLNALGMQPSEGFGDVVRQFVYFCCVVESSTFDLREKHTGNGTIEVEGAQPGPLRKTSFQPFGHRSVDKIDRIPIHWQCVKAGVAVRWNLEKAVTAGVQLSPGCFQLGVDFRWPGYIVWEMGRKIWVLKIEEKQAMAKQRPAAALRVGHAQGQSQSAVRLLSINQLYRIQHVTEEVVELRGRVLQLFPKHTDGVVVLQQSLP